MIYIWRITCYNVKRGMWGIAGGLNKTLRMEKSELKFRNGSSSNFVEDYVLHFSDKLEKASFFTSFWRMLKQDQTQISASTLYDFLFLFFFFCIFLRICADYPFNSFNLVNVYPSTFRLVTKRNMLHRSKLTSPAKWTKTASSAIAHAHSKT